MFPGLRQRLDAALDLIVEFSTLGEYRLAAPAADGAPSAPHAAIGRGPRLGGAGGDAARAADRQHVAGGAAVATRSPGLRVPQRGAAATPAARRLALEACAAPAGDPGERRSRLADPLERRSTRRAGAFARMPRSRSGAPDVPEQLCLAV
jgi:hypothetical protein